MNFNKPQSPEARETKDSKREKYYKDILKTAEKRESVSKSLTKELGITNSRDFVKKACRAAKNANLPIEELKDNETITLKILELQDKVLNFKFEDNKENCDAKLGPITFYALLEKFPVLKQHIEKRQAEIKGQKGQRQDLAADYNLPKKGAETKPEVKSKDDKKKEAEGPKEAIQGGKFIEQWNYIKTIQDPNQLLGMKDSVEFKPQDPLIRLPDERDMRLREGAALRYALFKQYALLKGYKITLSSSYRTIAEQTQIWNAGLAKRLRWYNGDYKKAYAENRRMVGLPGKSHHHTGGAVDISVNRIPDGGKIVMRTFSQSSATLERAIQGDMAGLSAADRRAAGVRKFLDEELKASHFLGSNYHGENWHWNIDGKRVYKNV